MAWLGAPWSPAMHLTSLRRTLLVSGQMLGQGASGTQSCRYTLISDHGLPHGWFEKSRGE